MSEIQDKLNESIPPHFVSDKAGLSYVSHRYVKNRLNEVFGWDGWSYTIQRVDLDPDNNGAFVHVRLKVEVGEVHVTRDGLAYGFPANQTGPQAYDFAIAEAVTDALKRAAVSLGNSMGLELYPMSKGAPEPKKDIIAEIPVIKDFANAIAEAATLDVLKFVGEQIRDADLSASGKGGLSTLFKAKKKELEG